MIRFGKVYDFVHTGNVPQNLRDDALRFEPSYYDFGAVTKRQQKAVRGHYFTFNWRAPRALRAGRITWEYFTELASGRRPASKSAEFRIKTSLPAWQRTRFSVTGDEFSEFGKVMAWRLRIYEADKLLGEMTSFAWPGGIP